VWYAQLSIDEIGKISTIEEPIQELEDKVTRSFKDQKIPDIFKWMFHL